MLGPYTPVDPMILPPVTFWILKKGPQFRTVLVAAMDEADTIQLRSIYVCQTSFWVIQFRLMQLSR